MQSQSKGASPQMAMHAAPGTLAAGDRRSLPFTFPSIDKLSFKKICLTDK